MRVRYCGEPIKPSPARPNSQRLQHAASVRHADTAAQVRAGTENFSAMVGRLNCGEEFISLEETHTEFGAHK